VKKCSLLIPENSGKSLCAADWVCGVALSPMGHCCQGQGGVKSQRSIIVS